MKIKCPQCQRNVGVTKEKPHRLVKHRTGRSRPHNVKPVCSGVGTTV